MEYDIIIIGAGPAGYVAAIRAAQVGLKTALIEREYIGGMCLNWGCIPTKTLIESARLFTKIRKAAEYGIDGIDKNNLSLNWEKTKSRSDTITRRLTSGIKFLLKRNGVDVITGNAVITGEKSVNINDREITAEFIIISTGSKPSPVSMALEQAPVIEMEKLFSLDSLPENITVTGNHVSSVEMAQFFNMIGKKTSLVTNSNSFMAGLDDHLVSDIIARLKKEKINLYLNSFPEKYENGNLIFGDKSIKCDLIVNINSRRATIPESTLPIELTEKGFIKTDDYFETSVKGIYAIGDVTGKSFVAHVASAQGIYVINKIKGIDAYFNERLYPINMYTTPEIAQIGLTEQHIKEEGIDYKVSEFPLSANGKAMIEGNTEGYLRMLSEKKYGQVLGVQIVAPNATDMISEAAILMAIEGTVFDVAGTIHAHPTISEIFMEAGYDAFEKAIHK